MTRLARPLKLANLCEGAGYNLKCTVIQRRQLFKWQMVVCGDSKLPFKCGRVADRCRTYGLPFVKAFGNIMVIHASKQNFAMHVF
eukprot:c19261_g1_i1 orf=698-952(+)